MNKILSTNKSVCFENFVLDFNVYKAVSDFNVLKQIILKNSPNRKKCFEFLKTI